MCDIYEKMLFLGRYIFLFLWLATIKCEDIDSIVKSVNINKNNEIEFDGLKLKYNILFSPENIRRKEIQMNQVNALYLILSCSFAEKTILSLCNLIVNVPLFHSHTFLNSDYNNQLINYNSSRLKINLIKIQNTISKFITLYKRYLKEVLIPNLLYYNDNDILRIFGSLYIKIKILFSDNQEYHHTDMLLIREILEEMNAIQIFLLMNCDNSERNIKKKYTSTFYGYTVIEQNVTWESNVERIFVGIQEPIDCSIEQIFLQNFLAKTSTDPVHVHDISNSTVNIFNENNIKMKDFFIQIHSTYDINAIYWYMKSILATIMKLLFSRLIEGIQKSYLTKKIIITISKIIFFFNDYTKIPIDLYEGFKLLVKLPIKNRNEYDDEKSYVEMINKLYTFYYNIKPNILLVKYYNIELLDIQDKSSKDEDYDIKTLKEDKSEFQKYLNSFLNEIKRNIIDFECYWEYLQYLENPIHKQYLPSNILKPKEIKSIDKVEYLEECYFIMEIYYISIKSDILVNKSKYQKFNPNDSNKSTLLKARKIINDIRNKFVMYLKLNKNNLKLFKVVKDIVIILENLPPKNQILEMAFLKRIIYFINAKLNNWGLEYCSQPKFNFLFFNNIHLIKVAEHDTEKIDFYDNNPVFFNFSNIIETKDYQCFSFKYLHSNFIEKNEIFKNYSSVISLKWNDETTNIYQVFSDLSNSFFKSHYLYIFHEIYYIFHIAAYYYDLKIIANAYYNRGKNEGIKFDQDECKVDKDRAICPEYLSGLLYSILELKKKLCEKSIDNMTTYNMELDYIQDNINLFNIVFLLEDEKDKMNEKKKQIKSIKSIFTITKGKISDFNSKKIVQSMSALYTECYEITQFDYNKTSPTKPVIMRLDSYVSTSESEDDDDDSLKAYLIKKPTRQ
ncbi:Uncharacterized protein FWK35_00033480 [Aphis craccivora]|uniref:Uncharacterized protein n=1 Tax=Aphis craccivora TaxID=307492 RepID=A0A6G0Y2Q6_APHCR|nr:Uncharacterized protein FWK35_00033480 [Aphis craccivora]